jgi:predicted transcriptional regulator
MVNPAQLSRRERQIMDIVYRRGEVSTNDVMKELPDPPSNSAIRALLRILVNKGHLRYRDERGRYLFSPTQPRHQAARSALRRVLSTFFDNSVERAVAALLGDGGSVTDDELERIQKIVKDAKKMGR